MSKNVFQAVGGARIRRSALDLSHRVTTAIWPGMLVPLPPIECMPGDVHKLGFNGVVRLTPLVTPAMQPMKLRYYAYFVPYRILDENWERFFTGGDDGTYVGSMPVQDPADAATPANVVQVGSLWDYFGWRTGTVPPTEACPLDYPRRAYLKIWNEYFRVPGLQDEVDIEDPELYMPLYRSWTRDYFTAALPWTQRGISPSLPVFGSAGLDVLAWSNASTIDYLMGMRQTGGTQGAQTANPSGSVTANITDTAGAGNRPGVAAALAAAYGIDGSQLSSADITDFRTAMQLQVLLERNARAGSRYTEQLQAIYDIGGNLDVRLQRPEYIGGSVTDVIISEVQQTSETAATPQGTLAGHGISLPRGYVGSYRVQEHGVIIQMVCVTPEQSYSQGIDRSWLRRTRFDIPMPDFVALGEQEIFNAEIWTTPASTDPDGSFNLTPWGYTGRYNELRYIPNKVTAQMRPGELYEQWTGTRDFAGLPPLNEDFISMEAAIPDLMRPFAVQNEPPFLCIFGIRLDSYRPIPFLAEPAGFPGGG